MRTLPAILLAALVALVILTSALLATQYGTRDWPAPPMPDTATRLITPTEAAGRAGDRIADSGDAVDVKVTVDAGAGDSRRIRPRVRTGVSRRAERTRRDVPRRDQRGGRRSGGRGSHTGGDDPRDPATVSDDAATPVTPEPSTPAPAESAPVAEARAGDQTQARPADPAPSAPAVPDVVVPELPTGGDDAHADGDRDADGHRRGRGPIRELLDQPR